MMNGIPLTNSYSSSIVDAEGLRKASGRKWRLDRHRHVISTDHPQVYLHHLVNGKPPVGFETDHKNGNPLDNRRSNLRNVTHSQNGMNGRKHCDTVSRFKGVIWHPGRKRWRAKIRANGKRKYLGHFVSPIEAAKAYDLAAKKFFGEFARLNFPMRFPRLMRFPRE